MFSIRHLLVLFLILSANRIYAQGCTVTAPIDTLSDQCTSSLPVVLPPGQPLGGFYIGEGVIDGVFYPELAGQGVITLTYSYEDGFCIGSFSTEVNVVTFDPIELSGDFLVCPGESTTITAESGSGFLWESGSKDTTQTFIQDTTTLHFLTGIDDHNCPAPTYFTIEVSEPLLIAGDTTMCPGQSSTLLSLPLADSYLWSTGDTTQTLFVLVDAPLSVSVITVDTVGCTSSDYVIIEQFLNPVITVVGDDEICQSETSELTLTGGEYYTIEGTNFMDSIFVSPDVTAVYSIDGFNAQGCKGATTFSIIVHDTLALEVSGIESICNGQSLSINATGFNQYIWKNRDNFEILQEGTVESILLAPTISTNYELEAYDEFDIYGCSSHAFFEIVVNELPPVNIVGESFICSNETTLLTAVGAENYTWNDETSGATLLFSSLENTVVSLIGTSAEGCVGYDSLQIIVDNEIPGVSIGGDHEICRGDTSYLLALGAPNYLWNNDYNGQILEIHPLVDTVYHVLGTNAAGCSGEASFAVIVNELPQISILGPDLLCYGDSITLLAISQDNIQWLNGSLNDSILVSPLSDTTFTAFATNNNGCSKAANLMVHVNLPPILVISGDTIVCAGSATTLTVSGAFSYLWNNEVTGNTFEIAPMVSGSYELMATDSNGCVQSKIFHLTALATPYVYFAFTADSLCLESPSVSYFANPAGGTLLGDGVVNNVFSASNAIVGTNEVAYSITNANGCTSTATDILYAESCSDISENIAENFSIYPNPVENLLFIKNDSGKQFDSIQLFDLEGRKFYTSDNLLSKNSEVIEMKNFASGLYVVLITMTDGSSFSQKLMKD